MTFRFRILHEVGALTDRDRLYLLFFLPPLPHGYLHSYPSGGPYLELDGEPGILYYCIYWLLTQGFAS